MPNLILRKNSCTSRGRRLRLVCIPMSTVIVATIAIVLEVISVTVSLSLSAYVSVSVRIWLTFGCVNASVGVRVSVIKNETKDDHQNGNGKRDITGLMLVVLMLVGELVTNISRGWIMIKIV